MIMLYKPLVAWINRSVAVATLLFILSMSRVFPQQPQIVGEFWGQFDSLQLLCGPEWVDDTPFVNSWFSFYADSTIFGRFPCWDSTVGPIGNCDFIFDFRTYCNGKLADTVATENIIYSFGLPFFGVNRLLGPGLLYNCSCRGANNCIVRLEVNVYQSAYSLYNPGLKVLTIDTTFSISNCPFEAVLSNRLPENSIIPTRDYITIYQPEQQYFGLLELFDNTGRLLRKYSIRPDSVQTIDIVDLPIGYYLARLTSKDGSVNYSQRFLRYE
jgi:hypothetical protein